MARPRKDFSPAQIRQLGKLATYGLTLEQIADFFAVHEATVRRRFLDAPEVLHAYKSGKAKGLQAVAGALYRQAIKGKGAAPFFYLKTQAGWRETERHEVTGAEGGPIAVEDVTEARERLFSRVNRIAARVGTSAGAPQPSGNGHRRGLTGE